MYAEKACVDGDSFKDRIVTCGEEGMTSGARLYPFAK